MKGTDLGPDSTVPSRGSVIARSDFPEPVFQQALELANIGLTVKEWIPLEWTSGMKTSALTLFMFSSFPSRPESRGLPGEKHTAVSLVRGKAQPLVSDGFAKACTAGCQPPGD